VETRNTKRDLNNKAEKEEKKKGLINTIKPVARGKGRGKTNRERRRWRKYMRLTNAQSNKGPRRVSERAQALPKTRQKIKPGPQPISVTTPRDVSQRRAGREETPSGEVLGRGP